MGTAIHYDLGTTNPLILQAGNKTVAAQCRVVKHFHEAPLVLGRPELYRLGLVTLHLPPGLPSTHTPTISITSVAHNLAEPTEPRAPRVPGVAPADQQRHDLLMIELKPLLDQNQKLRGFAKVPPVSLNLTNRDPMWISQYHIPRVYHPAVQAQIDKWFENGRIAITRSLWNFPLTAATKKDAEGNPTGTRVCLDTRQPNKRMQTDGFTIPNIRDTFASFQGMEYFADLDLEDGRFYANPNR
jgi:hypothetical protein